MPRVIAEWCDTRSRMGLPWVGPGRDDFAEPHQHFPHPVTGLMISASTYANLVSPAYWERAVIEIDYPKRPLVRWIRGQRDVYGFCTETETLGEATHIDEAAMIATMVWEGGTDPQFFKLPKQIEIVQERDRHRDLWRHEL